MSRAVRYVIVSVMGTAVQLLTLAVLSAGARWPAALATTFAVLAALLHNFIWHSFWTWSDRSLSQPNLIATFGRFVLANGVVSLVGNVAITVTLAAIGVSPVLANIVAIAICGLCNFWLADNAVWTTS
jgi:putative flippase GtrA